MPLDVDDLALFDFVETVTVYRKGPDGSTTVYQNVKGLRRAISAPTTEGAVQKALDRATWHIQASTIAVRPARGDLIKDESGNYWLVMGEAVLSFGTRYRLDTIKREDP